MITSEKVVVLFDETYCVGKLIIIFLAAKAVAELAIKVLHSLMMSLDSQRMIWRYKDRTARELNNFEVVDRQS